MSIQHAQSNVAEMFRPQLNSVDLNGTDEYFINNSNLDYGWGSTVSIAAWFKPDRVTGVTQHIFATNEFGIGNEIQARVTDEDITVRVIEDVGPTIIKDWVTTLDTIVIGAWQHVCVAWSSTNTLEIYIDGVNVADVNITKSTDLTGSTISVNRRMWIGTNNGGGNFDGRIHSVNMYSSLLDASNVAAIYNGGDGTHFDLNRNQGNYDEAGNLVHWWRLGHDTGVLGQDYALNPVTAERNIGTNNLNSADVVVDSPT